MKKIFVLIAVIVLVSCSKDDNAVVTKKMLTSFTVTENGAASTTELAYDENRNITGITTDGVVKYTFAYNKGNLIVMYDGPQDDPNTNELFNILYQNNQPSDYIGESGISSFITYNATTRKYIFVASALEVLLKNRDIASINETEGDILAAIAYDETEMHFGCLHNAPNSSIWILPFFTDTYSDLSTQAMTSVTLNGTVYTAANTFDEEGYVTKMVLTSAGATTRTVEYHYTQM
ncbi:MAG: hypothetical protein DI539_05685 [Flavobacterium psychrophilum]|nr:MAG: hypothetical protein DI539_05685 [Flavobacterium psychrophilum]